MFHDLPAQGGGCRIKLSMLVAIEELDSSKHVSFGCLLNDAAYGFRINGGQAEVVLFVCEGNGNLGW